MINNFKTNLLLVRGLPGSSKSTYARKWIEDKKVLGESWMHFEADMWAVDQFGKYTYVPTMAWYYHAKCQEATFKSLLDGYNVIVSNTFTTYYEMVPYFDIAKKCNARVSVLICKGVYNNIHEVPSEVLQAMEERWEE